MEPGSGVHIIATTPGIQGLSFIHGPVIVLDSSFNPPTNAHVALLREAVQRVKRADPEGAAPPLAILSLSPTNADKGAIGAADIAQRRTWLSALTKHLDNPELAIAAVLLDDAGLFVQKRRRLRDLLPAADRFIFLMGDDTLRRFLTPAYYHAMGPQLADFFTDAEIYVAPRIEGDDYLKEALGSWAGPSLHQMLADRVHILSLPKSYREISSTMVRSLWGSRMTAAAAIPDAHEKLLKELVPSCILPPASTSNDHL